MGNPPEPFTLNNVSEFYAAMKVAAKKEDNDRMSEYTLDAICDIHRQLIIIASALAKLAESGIDNYPMEP